jgi:oligopeptide/dipeptide ABC transporter ATP-binding protein
MSHDAITWTALMPAFGSAPMPEPLLQVEGLSKHYPVARGLAARLSGRARAPLIAVDDVSFDIARGEVFSLVGESGSGKTTLGRCLLRLVEPTAGRVLFDGTDLAGLSPAGMRAARRDVQMIFQDPFSSLNPRLTLRETLAEVLRVHRLRPEAEIAGRVAELLGLVGLSPEAVDRAPKAFSGGQRQRIGIARALAVEPRFIVADEPVSAVDVSVQAQIMNLLLDLRDRLGLTLLFIAHDLSVVRYLSDRVGVMYLGRIVEAGARDQIFGAARHPYTRALLRAAPRPDPARRGGAPALMGEPPSPLDPPPGCHFQTRCPHATEICRTLAPPPETVAAGHVVRCHHHASL